MTPGEKMENGYTYQFTAKQNELFYSKSFVIFEFLFLNLTTITPVSVFLLCYNTNYVK